MLRFGKKFSTRNQIDKCSHSCKANIYHSSSTCVGAYNPMLLSFPPERFRHFQRCAVIRQRHTSSTVWYGTPSVEARDITKRHGMTLVKSVKITVQRPDDYQVTGHGVHVFRVRKLRIARRWVIVSRDVLAHVRQLGRFSSLQDRLTRFRGRTASARQ